MATLEYRTAVDDYMRDEVLPYVPDAWVDHDKTKIGYEIPLTRHFYKYVPPRPLAEIDAEIKALEAEIQRLLARGHERDGRTARARSGCSNRHAVGDSFGRRRIRNDAAIVVTVYGCDLLRMPVLSITAISSRYTRAATVSSYVIGRQAMLDFGKSAA